MILFAKLCLITHIHFRSCLSYIVDLVDGVDIYKQHIRNKFFWEALDEDSQEEISNEVHEDISAFCSPIIEVVSHVLINMMQVLLLTVFIIIQAMKKDIDTAHVLILEKKIELIKQKKKHTTEFQTLMAFNYL